MKTRQQGTSHPRGLPPAPAPPARDANPWTISRAESPRAVREAGAQARTPQGAAPGAQRRPRFPVRQLPHPKPRRPAVVPVLIMAVVALVPLGAALRALGAGAAVEAIGPLLVVAFIAWRMLRRRGS